MFQGQLAASPGACKTLAYATEILGSSSGSLSNAGRLRMSPTIKNAVGLGPASQQEPSQSDCGRGRQPESREGRRVVTHPPRSSALLAHQSPQRGMQGSTAAPLLPTAAPGCPAAPILPPLCVLLLAPQDGEVVPVLWFQRPVPTPRGHRASLQGFGLDRQGAVPWCGPQARGVKEVLQPELCFPRDPSPKLPQRCFGVEWGPRCKEVTSSTVIQTTDGL